jgi:uncharacterized lipoprotein YajG
MFYSSFAMNFKLRSLSMILPILAGLLLLAQCSPAQTVPADKPTVADALARDFIVR